MEENISKKNQDEEIERKKRFDGFKKFFAADLRIKDVILSLAPTEKDESDKDARIDYYSFI